MAEQGIHCFQCWCSQDPWPSRVSGITFLDLLYQATLWHWQSGETMMQTFHPYSDSKQSVSILSLTLYVMTPSSLPHPIWPCWEIEVVHFLQWTGSALELCTVACQWHSLTHVFFFFFFFKNVPVVLTLSSAFHRKKKVNDLRRLVSVSSLHSFFVLFFCYDEMSAIIRSFHSSTSLDRATPPRPSCPFPFPHHTEPNHVGWEGLLYWVCGHGGGWVGAMRDTEDLPLDVWSSFFPFAFWLVIYEAETYFFSFSSVHFCLEFTFLPFVSMRSMGI